MRYNKNRRKEKLHHQIIDTILREPIIGAYKVKDHYWYIIELTKGAYLHYTFNWTNAKAAIEYKILPQYWDTTN